MRRTIGAAVVFALVLGVASCGGTEGRLTRAQFVKTLITACAEGLAASRAAMHTSPSAPDYRERLAASYLAGQRLLVKRIERIQPPAAAAHDFAVFMHGERQKLAGLERLQGTSGPAFDRVVQEGRKEQEIVFEQIHAIWKRYRLDACV